MPSSLQLYTQAISDFKRLQGSLNEKQGKISADSKADTFAQLGDDLTLVQNYKLSIDKSARFKSSIADAQRKNDTMFQAIQQIIDLATSFKQNLTIESSSATAGANNLTQHANASLDSIRGALNIKDGVNFAFAGSKTDQEPVGNLKIIDNVASGVPTANYYSGDDFKAKVDVSSSLQVEYGVTAADGAFKKLIGAINLAKNEESTHPSNGNYTQAGTMLDSAISDLISLQAKVSDNASLFESSAAYHDKAQQTFQEKYSEVNSPDIVQLTVETSQAQATLQASFMAFSKISQLNLINYL